MKLLPYILLTLFSQISLGSDQVCSDYKIDESRYFSKNEFIGVFGAPKIAYKVTRVEAQKYYVEVNPTFFELNPKMSSLNVPINEFVKVPFGRERVAECFEWYNQTYSKTSIPQIGLGLSEDPKGVLIRVNHEPNFRSYSRHYSEKKLKSSCSFVIHEILHIVGLWDEYDESKKSDRGGLLSFNCRSRSDSIMSNYAEYSTNIPSPNAYLICGCHQNDNLCSTQLDSYAKDFSTKNTIQECPHGLVEIARGFKKIDPDYEKTSLGIVSDINVWKKPFAGVSYLKAKLFPSGDAKELRPLRPAHITQILFPKCTARNKIYKACISNVYRSKGTILSCNRVPDVCAEHNLWLEGDSTLQP